jgi:hypothetical protein
MLSTSFVLQDSTTGRTSALIDQIVELAGAARFRRLRVAVAYATRAGCGDLCRRLETRMLGWRRLEKYWLVSIDFGRTEVEALQYLLGLPNSQIRIPNASELLASNLNPRSCFHPKTFIFDSGTDTMSAPFAVLVGSGNLTMSGLNTGVEHAAALLWTPPLNLQQASILTRLQGQLSWWTELWENSERPTADLLTEYKRRRPVPAKEDRTASVRHFVSTTPRVIEPEPGLAWANARCFWIQTRELYKNRGRGEPGNQLDLTRGSRVYFGFRPDRVPLNTVLGQVLLQYDGFSPRECSVRFGNNSMDKVNLPIPGDDGPASYDNSVIHFTRTGPRQFDVRLGSNRDLARWERRSRAQKLRYEMTGGRPYGFYT